MTDPIETPQPVLDRLSEFVETFSPRCPGCHETVTSAHNGRCPSCQVRLELGLGAPISVLTWWIALVSGVALGFGFTGLVSILALKEGAGGVAWSLYVAGIVNAALLAAAFLLRPQFIRMKSDKQILTVALGLLALLLFDFIAMWIAID